MSESYLNILRLSLLPPVCVIRWEDNDLPGVSLSVHRGVPHLHPLVLPLVPCLFQGVPQWLVPGPFLDSTTPARTECPLARTWWGTPPKPRLYGVALGQVMLGQVIPWVVCFLRFPTGGLSQRRIQDFPEKGALTPKRRHQPIIWPIFQKNCMKIKKFWTRGRHTSLAPLRSATVSYFSEYISPKCMTPHTIFSVSTGRR